MYQFVLRSDKTNRYNQLFTSLRHHAAQMMLLMVNGERPDCQLRLESHYLALISDIYRELIRLRLPLYIQSLLI